MTLGLACRPNKVTKKHGPEVVLHTFTEGYITIPGLAVDDHHVYLGNQSHQVIQKISLQTNVLETVATLENGFFPDVLHELVLGHADL